MAECFVPDSGGGQAAAKVKKGYTQAEIEAMTKANILALGTQFGYNMTTTEANTKEQIVADFMAQQAADQGA